MKKHSISFQDVLRRALVALLLLVMAAGVLGCGAGDASVPAITVTFPRSFGAEEETQETQPVSFDPITLVDEEGLSITLTGFDETPNPFGGPTAYLHLKNASEKSLYFYVGDVGINGYSLTSFRLLTQDPLAPGGEADAMLEIADEWYTSLGFDRAYELNAWFWFYDGDTSELWHMAEPVSVPLPGAKAGAFIPDESGTVVYNENGVKLIVQDLLGPLSDQPAIRLYAYDTRSDYVFILLDELSINGKPIKSDTHVDLIPGMRRASYVSLSKDELAKEGIDQIREMKASFTILTRDVPWIEGEASLLAEPSPVTVRFDPVVFEPQTLLDRDGVRLTITDVGYSDLMSSFKIYYTATNANSEEADVWFTGLGADGWAVEQRLAAYLDPGETYESLIWVPDFQEKLGIQDPHELLLGAGFRFPDREDEPWYYADSIRIPLSKDAPSPIRIPDSIPLLEGEGVSIGAVAFRDEPTRAITGEDYSNPTLVLLIQNSSDRDCVLEQSADLLLNGKSAYSSCMKPLLIPAGGCALMDFDDFTYSLSAAEVESMQLQFRLVQTDGSLLADFPPVCIQFQ